MIAILLCIFLTEVIVCRSDNMDGWAPSHGLTWGVLNEVQCPNGGVITGFRYRSDQLVQLLGFYCTSSEGETLIGPFGGVDNNTLIDDKCPQGYYVRSIHGRGSAALDAVGIDCSNFEGSDKIKSKLHGGNGGTEFDDESFTGNGKGPTVVRVWAIDDLITAVQVQYGNVQIPFPSNTKEEVWAPSHGLTWGVLNEVQCPNGGVITGIRYRSKEVVERLGFYCTSSESETLIGPFGGANDNKCVDDKCPKGMYVRSIHGRGSAALDAFGINCEAEGGQKVQLQLHGGNGGSEYDDTNFTSNGKRPSEIKVWAMDDLITAVQVKYF